MMLSGAEVHRAEESISRMCQAFGAVRVDVFIITSSMVVTIHTADGATYTQTRRVTSTGINFERLHQLNSLSREICEKHLTLQEIKKKLQAAIHIKTFPLWQEFLCYAMIAGAFTLFFGGSWIEAGISFGVGALVRLSAFLCNKIVSNRIFDKFFSAVVVTLLAFCAVKLGWVVSVDNIIIGNIMPLIPGIGLTNALRDLFTGDSIAGLLRSIESVLMALAIAAGYFVVTVLGGYVV